MYFNTYWKDLTNPDLKSLLRAAQLIDMTIKLGKKILVHCHAGQGRTGTVIAAYFIMF